LPLVDTLSASIADAMRQKDAIRLSTLRMLKAALMNREIERGHALDDSESLQVVASLGVFALLPVTLPFLLPALGSRTLQISVTLALLITCMTYLLLSWVWLIARILHDLLGGTPRGGHPVSAKS